MIGINVNDSRYPFTAWMFGHVKTIETRNKPTLRKYVGKRVGIIQTGKGKARCIGYVTIDKEIHYMDEISFYKDYGRHMINPFMKEFSFSNEKYGYVLKDIEPCIPFEVSSFGIVARKL